MLNNNGYNMKNDNQIKKEYLLRWWGGVHVVCFLVPVKSLKKMMCNYVLYLQVIFIHEENLVN